MPSSSLSRRRSDWYAARASAVRPHRYSATMSWLLSRSRRGAAATRPSSSATRSTCSPRRKARVHVLLDRCRAQLFQTRRLRSSPLVLHELFERRSPPQRERVRERPLGDETSEPDGVDRVGVDVEAIAGWVPDECLPDRFAELRDAKMQRVGRVRWERFAPQRVDQPVRGEHPAGFGGQEREQGPFAGTLQLNEQPVLDQLQRSEQSNFHASSPVIPGMAEPTGYPTGSLCV